MVNPDNPKIVQGIVPTAWGDFHAVVSAQGLARLGFPSESRIDTTGWRKRWFPEAEVIDDPKALAPVSDFLQRYLQGEAKTYQGPLHLNGTAFQISVWKTLQSIPWGEQRSYGDVAREVGRPSAVRAVGGAIGNNPVAIIIPCHRVIGSDGALVGFGGGLELKRRLLTLEGWEQQLRRG